MIFSLSQGLLLMIEILELPQYPVPFPRKPVGEFLTLEDAMAKMNWSKREMEQALEGNLVQQKYVLEWGPDFLHKLAIDSLVDDYPEGVNDLEELALLLNLKVEGVKSRLNRALKKLKSEGKLESFLRAVSALRAHKRRCRSYSFRAKITLTVEC